jgi:hypothetical protein
MAFATSSILIGLAVAGTVASAAQGVVGYIAQKKAAKAAKAQNALQRKQQELATRRQRRSAIREAQILRAQTQSAGAQYGALNGSAVSGALSGLGSQAGNTLGYSSQQSGISGDIFSIQQSNAAAQSRLGGISSIFGAIGQGTSFASSFLTPTKAPTNSPSLQRATASSQRQPNARGQLSGYSGDYRFGGLPGDAY